MHRILKSGFAAFFLMAVAFSWAPQAQAKEVFFYAGGRIGAVNVKFVNQMRLTAHGEVGWTFSDAFDLGMYFGTFLLDVGSGSSGNGYSSVKMYNAGAYFHGIIGKFLYFGGSVGGTYLQYSDSDSGGLLASNTTKYTKTVLSVGPSLAFLFPIASSAKLGFGGDYWILPGYSQLSSYQIALRFRYAFDMK